MKESRLDRGAAGPGGVESTGLDVRAGLDRPVALGRLVDQEAPCLVQAHAAADKIIGDLPRLPLPFQLQLLEADHLDASRMPRLMRQAR